MLNEYAFVQNRKIQGFRSFEGEAPKLAPHVGRWVLSKRPIAGEAQVVDNPHEVPEGAATVPFVLRNLSAAELQESTVKIRTLGYGSLESQIHAIMKQFEADRLAGKKMVPEMTVVLDRVAAVDRKYPFPVEH